MINISVKMYGNNGVEVIMNNNGILWLIEKHTKEESKHRNLPVFAKKNHSVYRSHKNDLAEKPKKQPKKILFT